MKQSHLNELLGDIAARRPVAVVTWLDSGEQQLVHAEELAGQPAELAERIRDGFRTDRSGTITIGDREAFVQINNPPLRMVAIGAVHISQALAPMAAQTGYDLIIVDPRTAFATEERFRGITLDARWPDEALPEIGLDARTAFLALTHDPKIDDPALHHALASNVFYIGALGSRRTHARRIERLTGQGIALEQLDRIQAPIGLDIGAIGPVEIALSIMAEITSALRGKLPAMPPVIAKAAV
jgi:xanthine dehydrogenase accessory factor